MVAIPSKWSLRILRNGSATEVILGCGCLQHTTILRLPNRSPSGPRKRSHRGFMQSKGLANCKTRPGLLVAACQASVATLLRNRIAVDAAMPMELLQLAQGDVHDEAEAAAEERARCLLPPRPEAEAATRAAAATMGKASSIMHPTCHNAEVPTPRGKGRRRHAARPTAWIGSTGVSWLDLLRHTTRLTRPRASRVATDHRPGPGRPHGRPTRP